MGQELNTKVGSSLSKGIIKIEIKIFMCNDYKCVILFKIIVKDCFLCCAFIWWLLNSIYPKTISMGLNIILNDLVKQAVNDFFTNNIILNGCRTGLFT